MIERPVCHRAEDLVTYLYHEASEADAQDFAAHMQQCDACRGEFAIFQQTHESILRWRNDALGVMTVPNLARASAPNVATARSQGEIPLGVKRRLPALAAIQQFFRVSPVWLRGATAVALVLFFAMILFSVSRMRPRYTQKDLDNEVAKQVGKRMSDLVQSQKLPAPALNIPKGATVPRESVAVRHIGRRNQARMARADGLTRQEREQLAADLHLIPGRDDELPFVFSNDPNW